MGVGWGHSASTWRTTSQGPNYGRDSHPYRSEDAHECDPLLAKEGAQTLCQRGVFMKDSADGLTHLVDLRAKSLSVCRTILKPGWSFYLKVPQALSNQMPAELINVPSVQLLPLQGDVIIKLVELCQVVGKLPSDGLQGLVKPPDLT